MSKFLLFLVTMLLCLVGYSQSLSFNEKLHNFGTILEENGVVSYTFVAKNSSKTPFIIKYISTGCGCTAAQYDKSPIMPNGSKEISITYDPKNRAGLFRTAINIVGGRVGENYTLHVTGNITPKVKTITDLFPIVAGKIRMKEDMIPFGIIPNRERHTYFIELYNHSKNRVKLEVKATGTKNTKTWLTETEVEPSQRSYIMYEIDLEGNDFLGDILDNISLTIDGVEHRNKIRVSATIIPNVYDYTIEQLNNSPIATLYKTKHTISNIDSNNCSYTFEIENSAAGELKILKAIKRYKAVDYTIHFSGLKANQKGEITLTLNPEQFDEKANGVVTFITSSPHTPIFSLTLTGVKN